MIIKNCDLVIHYDNFLSGATIPLNIITSKLHLRHSTCRIIIRLSVIKVSIDGPSSVKNVSVLSSPSFSIAPEFFTLLLLIRSENKKYYYYILLALYEPIFNYSTNLHQLRI